MTDYSLWEVILNGDSPAPTRVIEDVLQPVAPTTAKQRLARKNELKDRGTLLMALPDKHQLKFNSHKDAKTMMEAIKKRFGGSSTESLDQIHDRLQKLISQLEILGINKTDLEEQILDDLFNSLKIYEAEVKNSSSASTSTQNLAFVSSSNTDSTNESVNAAASVSAVSTKIPVIPFPNVDSLSNVVIYSFFASQSNSLQIDNDDLKQIDADDLKEMDLKFNGPTSMGFDMSKVECYNCHKKGNFARECRSPKDTRRNGATEPQIRSVLVETTTSNALVSQCDGVGSYDWIFQAEEDPTNYALMAFSSSSSSSDNENNKRDDLKLKLEKFQTSSKNLIELLASQTNAKTGTFMPPKPDLVFNNATSNVKTDHLAFTIKLSPTKPDQDLSLTIRSSAPIIEDWVSDSEDESETKTQQNVPSFVQSTEQVKSPRPSVQHVETSIPVTAHKSASLKPTDNGKLLTQSKPVPITGVRPVSTAVPTIKVTRPRHVKPVFTKINSPIRQHINRSPSSKTSNSPSIVNVVKAPVVNAAQGLQGKWEWQPKCLILDHVSRNTSASMTLKRFDYNDALGRSKVIDSGCSRHMTGNISYISDFEELNGGYVAFGGNPKGGKISRKGKIRTRKLDFDDVYFVKELKFNLFSVLKMCDKKNSVLFTNTECLVLSPDFKFPDESQVLLRVPRENNMYNVNLKNIVPSGDLTYLFTKPIIDESNLWYRRLDHINFKTMNKLVKGNLVRGLPTKVLENDNTCVACKNGKEHRASCKTNPVSSVDQPLYRLHMDLFRPTFVKSLNKKHYCLVFIDDYSSFTNPQNTNGDVSFDEKEPDLDVKKPESEVNVSPSSSAQSKKQDDKNKSEAKGKRPVESFTGYRNLSAEFKDYSDNSINEVNAAGTLVPAVGPTQGKSSCIDASQHPNDPDMPEFEGINYSDDEDDVGAEADFNNLETSITVSPIPTTRVHKDHLVTQIIEEPKRVPQALKDPRRIEAMQEELLQFKMQKVRVLVDLPYGKRAIVLGTLFYLLTSEARSWRSS
nr:ribonuclease H-like domain-containing protein [Tanacetum cinerariifolium]